MTKWPDEELRRIAETDDLHVTGATRSESCPTSL